MSNTIQERGFNFNTGLKCPNCSGEVWVSDNCDRQYYDGQEFACECCDIEGSIVFYEDGTSAAVEYKNDVLTGTYADSGVTYEYVTRVFWWGEGRNLNWRDGINRPVEIKHGDVLKMLGHGTWCALYRPKKDND